MTYEFNISKDGRHLFATHERSATDSDTANKLRDILIEKFPNSEGYNVSVSLNPCRSYGFAIHTDMSAAANAVYDKLRHGE